MIVTIVLYAMHLKYGIEMDIYLMEIHWLIIISIYPKRDIIKDTMAEWLRRLTRNQLGSSRAGSNPARVAAIVIFFFRKEALLKAL